MVETFEVVCALVRASRAQFPGEYWPAIDTDRAYPEALVRAATDAALSGEGQAAEAGCRGRLPVRRGHTLSDPARLRLRLRIHCGR
jgi:hypothetical protein